MVELACGGPDKLDVSDASRADDWKACRPCKRCFAAGCPGSRSMSIIRLQALPIGWDFVEGCPFSADHGSFEKCTHNLDLPGHIYCVAWFSDRPSPIRRHGPAATYSNDSAVWFTDPPYYDAIPVRDLSDFFLVWLKRALPGQSAAYCPTHSIQRTDCHRREPRSGAGRNASSIVEGHPKDAAGLRGDDGERLRRR